MPTGVLNRLVSYAYVMWPIDAGELFFGFIEENANATGTVGGRFINASLTVGLTIIIPQGEAPSMACSKPQVLQRMAA